MISIVTKFVAERILGTHHGKTFYLTQTNTILLDE